MTSEAASNGTFMSTNPHVHRRLRERIRENVSRVYATASTTASLDEASLT